MNNQADTRDHSTGAITTSQTIADTLSRAIFEHRISPGTKLGEDDLGTIFGVSRTVVRAALQALSHAQLIDIQRNRGAFVAQPTLQEAQEVFEARELLEPRTAHGAALLATPQDITILRHHIEQEHAELAAADHGRALYQSGLFHIEIARIAQQTTIAGFVAALVARSSLIIALYWSRQSALCESDAHHMLVDAIAAKDGARAETLMRRHLLDLHSALDLTDRVRPARSLRDALQI